MDHPEFERKPQCTHLHSRVKSRVAAAQSILHVLARSTVDIQSITIAVAPMGELELDVEWSCWALHHLRTSFFPSLPLSMCPELTDIWVISARGHNIIFPLREIELMAILSPHGRVQCCHLPFNKPLHHDSGGNYPYLSQLCSLSVPSLPHR